MKTYHFIIKGEVQGVGYRITAYLNATRLGINGSVKNLPNDNVEVFAQGDEKVIDKFKKYLKFFKLYINGGRNYRQFFSYCLFKRLFKSIAKSAALHSTT